MVRAMRAGGVSESSWTPNAAMPLAELKPAQTMLAWTTASSPLLLGGPGQGRPVLPFWQQDAAFQRLLHALLHPTTPSCRLSLASFRPASRHGAIASTTAGRFI